MSCAPARDVEVPSVAEGSPSAVAAPPPVQPTATVAADDATAPAAALASYVRVLRRPRLVLGLAEARGVSAERTESALQALADAMDRCAERAQAEGWLEPSVMRVVFELDPHGQVGPIEPQLEDPSRGGKLALLCVVAPIRSLNFGAEARPGRRGMALELRLAPALAP